MVAERYSGQAGRQPQNTNQKRVPVKIFCRNDLDISMMDASVMKSRKSDIEAEINTKFRTLNFPHIHRRVDSALF